MNEVIVAGLYLPNDNPRLDPKIAYKRTLFERQIDHAATLPASGAPIVPASDFNVMPTEREV